jgi:hypothetical protein
MGLEASSETLSRLIFFRLRVSNTSNDGRTVRVLFEFCLANVALPYLIHDFCNTHKHQANRN